MSPALPPLAGFFLAAVVVCAAAVPADGATGRLRQLRSVPVGQPVDMKPLGGGSLAMNVVGVNSGAQAVRGAEPGETVVAVYVRLVTSAGAHGRPSAGSVLQSVEAHGVLAVSASNRLVYQPSSAVVANCARLGAGVALGRHQWTATGCYTFEIPDDVTASEILFTPTRVSGSSLASWKTN